MHIRSQYQNLLETLHRISIKTQIPSNFKKIHGVEQGVIKTQDTRLAAILYYSFNGINVYSI